MACFLLGWILSSILLQTCKCRQHEADLMQKLLTQYDRRVRPVKDHKSVITVSLRFIMQRIDDLDLRREQLRVSGWTEVRWKDELLTWDPALNQDIEQLVFKAEEIWLPDVAVMNSLKGIFLEHTQAHSYRASVASSGVTRWTPADNFAVSCDVDISLFPFDHQCRELLWAMLTAWPTGAPGTQKVNAAQTCSIVFGSWHYTTESLFLVAKLDALDLSRYEEDGEWVLEETAVENVTEAVPSHQVERKGQFYSYVKFTIKVKRRPVFYLVNILLPTLMLCGLVLTNFFLPPDCGEKIGLGITVLLAFSVFQLLVAENVPTSSITTPILGVYLLCVMAASASSITFAVLVLNLHHRTIYSSPPTWLRVIVLHYMARLVCMRTHSVTRVQPIRLQEVDVVSDAEEEKQARHVPGVKVEGEVPHLAKTYGSKIRLAVDDLDQGLYPKIMVSDEEIALETAASGIILDNRHVRLARSRTDSHSSGSGNRHLDVASRGRDRGEDPTGGHQVTPGSSHHTMSAPATRSVIRLIRSLAHLDRPDRNDKASSTQDFIDAVRDVYNEMLTARQTEELSRAMENEWKLIARVVDRFFFWVTFTSVLVLTVAIFAHIQP